MATSTGSKRKLSVNIQALEANNTLTLGGNGVATQSWVSTQIAGLADSAPSTLDTLNELAAALGDDPNFATTITNSVATKLPLAGGTLTGALVLDHTNPSITFKGDDGIWYRARVDESGNQLELGHSTNIGLKLSNSGGVTFPQYGAGFVKTNANGVVSIDTNTYATQSWVGSQGYLTSLPAHDHIGVHPYINSSTADSRGPDFDALLPDANQSTYKEVHAINEGTNIPTGAYTYGMVQSTYMTSMKLQWYVPHTASRGDSDTQDTIYFRTNWGSGNWYGWKYLIHSGNIAGQSVNYANSAGAVTWNNVSGKPSTFAPSSHNHDGRYLRTHTRLSGNADSINASGIHIWDVSTADDDPAGAADGLLTTKYWDSTNWAVQSYHDFHSNKLYIRSKQSGIWQPEWAEVWTTDNFNPASYQPAGSYLTSIPSEYLTQTEGDVRYLQSLPSHNHDTLYDAIGAADVVNLRIDEEVLPAIDSKLDATAKAADSNLLDGIDSSAFIRENQNRAHKIIRFTGESSDSGNTAQNYAIYQAGGAWTHPFPDLVIAMHTGIKIGGYKNYGGVRIYNDAPERSGAVEVASFGNGDANVRISNNLHIGSAGGWITDLLNGKETAGAAEAVNARIEEEILPAIDGKLGSTAKATNSHAADGVNIGGYGTNEFSFYQTSGTFAGFTGWANYFIGNHGSGSSYYNTTHIMPFWGPPQYSRLEGGTFKGPYTYWTTENFNPTDKASTESVAAAQTAAIAHADNRLDSEILPVIDSKLDATGKAADADKLDGYDWMQSGKSVRANEFYADNWFRNYNSGEGLYNQATSQHWYSDGDDYWNIAGGSSFNAIRFRDEHAGTQRGLVGADSSNRIGFLDAGGAWAIRHDNDSGTLFYTDGETLEFRVGRDKVTGDYGTVQADTNKNGWGGYSIYGQYVLMSNGSRIGIYNDIDNEWMIQCYRNAQVELRHNGAIKLETTSGGVTVTGNVTATTFSGGLDWANVTNKPVIPVATEPVQAIVEGGNNSTLSSITFSEGEGAATFTLADGQSFRLAFAR